MKSRYPNRNVKFPWSLSENCPCGKGQPFGFCCAWNGNGFPIGRIPNLKPPGSKTGYSHSKCYLSGTENCSTKISGEHYISHSILSQYIQPMPISGMPWQAPGETTFLNASAMTSNILCERHNSALSPLDSAAGRALSRIAQAAVHALDTTKKKTEFFMVDGHALELWGIKTLAGIYYAKVASVDGRERLADTHTINIQAIEDAFFGAGICRPLGLHVQPTTGDMHTAEFGFAPLSTTDSKQVIGLLLQFSTVHFAFVLEKGPVPYQRLATNPMYRPWNIIFEGKKNFSHVVMTWNRRPHELPTVNLQVENH